MPYTLIAMSKGYWMEPITIECELCGSNKLTRRDDGLFHCDCCGAKYTVEAARQLLNGAPAHNHRRGDFIIRAGTLERYDGEGTDVVIPPEAKYIAAGTFKDLMIESVVLPEGLEKIEPETFRSCKKLKKVTFPSSLKEICNEAFYECFELEEVAFPPELDSIGDSAFEYCTSLSSVKLNDGIKDIGRKAFNKTDRLEVILVPRSCRSIGDVSEDLRDLFSRCRDDFKYVFEDEDLSCTVSESGYPTFSLNVSGKEIVRFFIKCSESLNEYFEKANLPDSISSVIRPVCWRHELHCQHCGGEFCRSVHESICCDCGLHKDY